MEATFELVQEPRSSGGVKYQCQNPIEGETRPWVIYVPQALAHGPVGGPKFAKVLILNLEPQL